MARCIICGVKAVHTIEGSECDHCYRELFITYTTPVSETKDTLKRLQFTLDTTPDAFSFKTVH